MKTHRLFSVIIIVLLLGSCKSYYTISSLEQNHYYATQINEQPFIIKVDTIFEVESKKLKVERNQKDKKPYSIPVNLSSSKVESSKFNEGVNLRVHQKFHTVLCKAYLIDNGEFTTPQSLQVFYKKRKTKAFLEGKNVSFSNSFEKYEPPTITKFPNCYLDSLYPVQVYKDVQYAQAEGYWESSSYTEGQIGRALLGGIVSTLTKKKLNLKMDIYVPESAENIHRPLLMLIHGGAFYVGDKSQQGIVKMCEHFASLGYTTASINYRIGFQPTQTSIERAGYMALQDAHAAMRFLIAHANKYQIDPEYLFAGGSSAGAITSLNLAFMRNENRPESSYKSFLNKDLGNIESVGKNQDITFQIKSVANLWGAVNDLNIIENNQVSVLSYHAVRDALVPYNYDYPMQNIVKKMAPALFSKMYGSKPVHDELRKLGYREKLVTINSDKHALWETDGKLNETFSQIINDMTHFFYVDIVPNPVIIENDPTNPQRYYISNTEDVDLITWQCEGGFVIHNYENELLIIWRTDATERLLITSGMYRNGASFNTKIIK